MVDHEQSSRVLPELRDVAVRLIRNVGRRDSGMDMPHLLPDVRDKDRI